MDKKELAAFTQRAREEFEARGGTIEVLPTLTRKPLGDSALRKSSREMLEKARAL
jgi:hypothetical protein